MERNRAGFSGQAAMVCLKFAWFGFRVFGLLGLVFLGYCAFLMFGHGRTAKRHLQDPRRRQSGRECSPYGRGSFETGAWGRCGESRERKHFRCSAPPYRFLDKQSPIELKIPFHLSSICRCSSSLMPRVASFAVSTAAWARSRRPAKFLRCVSVFLVRTHVITAK